LAESEQDMLVRETALLVTRLLNEDMDKVWLAQAGDAPCGIGDLHARRVV
jgi:hypothetical protein